MKDKVLENIEKKKFYALVSITSTSNHINYINFYMDKSNAEKALTDIYNELKKPNIYTTDPILRIDDRYLNTSPNVIIAYYKGYNVLYQISEKYFND